MTILLAIIIIIVYITIGMFLMSLFSFSGSDDDWGVLMIAFWPVILVILGVVWLFTTAYELGERLHDKIWKE